MDQRTQRPSPFQKTMAGPMQHIVGRSQGRPEQLGRPGGRRSIGSLAIDIANVRDMNERADIEQGFRSHKKPEPVFMQNRGVQGNAGDRNIHDQGQSKRNRGSHEPVAMSPQGINQISITPTAFSRTLIPGKNNRQLITKKGSAPLAGVAANIHMRTKPNEISPNNSGGGRSPQRISLPNSGSTSGKLRNYVTPPSAGAKPSIQSQLMQPRILGNSGSQKGIGKKQINSQIPQRANTLAQKLKMAKTVGPQAVISHNSTTKENTLYHPSLPHTSLRQHSSCFLNSNSSIAKGRPLPSRELIMSNLGRKYGNCHVEFENMKVINDLIYNEQTHMVSIFKDYLILDDINEFLKRFYARETESQVRLPKLCEFYEKYSQVFPNFISLPESKYMFRNIQRKQRLIDEQYQTKPANQKNKDGEAQQNSARGKDRVSLLNSSNKLFTTGFIDSVWNQQTCAALPDESWTAKRKEAQEKRYLESAKLLDRNSTGQNIPNSKIRVQRQSSTLFQPENLDFLVQKFLNKDSESTIRLNSSMGQVGDDILGDTFQPSDTSQRFSTTTVQKDQVKAEIGLIHRKQSDQKGLAYDPNRVSIIPNSVNATPKSVAKSQSKVFQTASRSVINKTGAQSVTSKVPNAAANSAAQQQLRSSIGKKSKPGSSGNSMRKSSGGIKSTPTGNVGASTLQSLIKAQTGPTGSQLPTSLKQKVSNIANQGNAQSQLGSRYLNICQQQNLKASTNTQPSKSRSGSRNNNFSNVKSHQAEEPNARLTDHQSKMLRDNYLECDIVQPIPESEMEIRKEKLKTRKLSQGAESQSQSPIEEGTLNPLSQQPLLSKTSLNKATQPGSSLELIKQQRTSDFCVGSATPTQHLYHSKQTSMKNTMPLNKMLPQLNVIQQQVESDYYSSGMMLQPGMLTTMGNKGQFLRSQTALNSIQNSNKPSMIGAMSGQHSAKTKKLSRDRSPPLMQTSQYQSKGKGKSPHKKKDKRSSAAPGMNNLAVLSSAAVSSQYQSGKSQASSAANSGVSRGDFADLRNNQTNTGRQEGVQSSIGASSQLAAMGINESGRPLSTQGSIAQPANLHLNLQKLYSQTEINEAEEDYPDDEVADEIPDPDDTEDEQDHRVSDDEGHANKSATTSMRDRLRPTDMLKTHGGAFNEDEPYLPEGGSGKQPDIRIGITAASRAKTSMACLQQPATMQLGRTKDNSSQQQLGQYQPIYTQQSVKLQSRGQVCDSAASSLLNFGSEVKSPNMPIGIDRPMIADFNSTQQVASIANARSGLKTELGLHPLDPTAIATGVNLPSQFQGPHSTSHAANRPNTIMITQQQSLSIRSKFSRENSVSSRQEAYQAKAGTNVQAFPEKKGVELVGSSTSLPQENHRILEASIKLGGKALQNQPGANTGSLSSSLRQSFEPAHQHNNQARNGSTLGNTHGRSSQYGHAQPARQSGIASANQSHTKLQNANSSQVKSSKQLQKNFQVDLTTRLTANLINDQLGKKKSTADIHARNFAQKSGAKTATNSQNSLAAASKVSVSKNASSFAKHADPQQKQRSNARLVPPNMTVSINQQQTSGIQANMKRKTVPTSQSPTQQSPKKLKRQSKETLVGFKAMGSGKASYLTNVGAAASQNTAALGSSSRNLTSPYATANQYQRIMPKDVSLASMPQAAVGASKAQSRSPPLSSTAKDSIVFRSTVVPSNNNSKSPNATSTLQQQLHQINRQLAIGSIKTSSYRQSNAISPSQQSQGSQSKKFNKGSTAMSPANGSQLGQQVTSGEKGKSRKSQDRPQQVTEFAGSKSLQRQAQKGKPMAASQALLSLPGQLGVSQNQKNLNWQLSRAPIGNKQLSRHNQQHLGTTIELKITGKQSQKVGNFLGQPRYQNTNKNAALSPPAQQTISTAQKLTKPKKSLADARASDRSLKSVHGAQNLQVKPNFFTSTLVEPTGAQSNEVLTLPRKGSDPHYLAATKKNSQFGSGRQSS